MVGDILSISSEISPVILITLGGFVGVISGLLGVGGGVLMTPALHILGLPMPAAVGTTLTQMVASSLSGTFKHHSQSNVSLPLVLAFGVPGVIGVLGGKEIMVSASHNKDMLSYLSLAYGGFLIFMALMMIRRQISKKEKQTASIFWTFGPSKPASNGSYKIYYIPCLLFGLLIGVISGLTGLGGGFFYMPIMSQVMGVPLKVSVGSSLAIVVMSSVMGAISYGVMGISNIDMAIVIAVGSICGSFAGASATKYVQGKTLKMFFAFLVLVAAISMILKFGNYPTVSFYLLFSAGLILFFVSLGNAIYNYRKGHVIV